MPINISTASGNAIITEEQIIEVAKMHKCIKTGMIIRVLARFSFANKKVYDAAMKKIRSLLQSMVVSVYLTCEKSGAEYIFYSTTIKKIDGLRSKQEYIANLKKIGYTIENAGPSWTVACNIRYYLLVNDLDGHFIVYESFKKIADESSDMLKGVDWYDELLNCFYIPKEVV